MVTVKDKGFTPNIGWIRRAAGILARLARRIIVVVGGGSYGHYAVKVLRDVGADPADTVSIVSSAMLELAMLVSDILMESGLKPIIYPPHSFCEPLGLKPNCNWSLVARSLELGLTPLTYGDIYPKDNGYIIVSGDELAAEAACRLGWRRVVYLSNVPGVLDSHGETIRFMGRSDVEKVLSSGVVGGSRTVDVTGGMRRKLEAILENSCPGLEAYIVDGDMVENLVEELARPTRATRIRF